MIEATFNVKEWLQDNKK
jgi:hypothetical protein